MKLLSKIFNGIDRFHFFIIDFAKTGFAEKWFSWLEWITITGAIYAIAKKVDSTLLFLTAAFSTFIVFCIALATFNDYIDNNFEKWTEEIYLGPPLRIFFAVVVGLFPVYLIIFISKIIQGMIL